MLTTPPTFPATCLTGTIVFSGWEWLWVGAVVSGLALVLAVWSYRTAPRNWVGWICPALKLIGVAALGLCLLEPLWSGQRVRPGANIFAVVADNSQGLQIKDRGATQSRGQELRALLNPGEWQSTMDRNFEVRRYYFDSRLQGSKDFNELVFDGRASSIGTSLRTIGERFRGRPLAGVLLFTDGNATDVVGESELQGLPPIYPVVLGTQDPVQDIAIQQVRVSQSAFEDAPVSIQADALATGYGNEPIIARVVDRAGKVVAEQTLRTRKPSELIAFRFQLKPETPGLSFYKLRVRSKSEVNEPDTLEHTGEATLANNSTVLAVDRGQGPYRILYVAGRPNWEFKFLNRALQEDPQLQLAALIRVAKREPKFNFLGRAGETSNPLFRGFGNQQDVEQYDQPVIVRLNTKDETELRDGFPKTAEDLYQFNAVVVDDLEAEFFKGEQATLLQKFVSERGGGFLMLGGMECFQQGKYQRTPIGDMLPVYLDKVDTSENPGPTQVHLSLTQEGWLESWARLRDNEADEKSRLQNMVPFQVLNRVREAKPGASVIARVQEESGKSYPALVVQRFGRGRSAALTVGDVWRWGLHDSDAHRDMDKAWRQLMRWLVTDVPNRVDVVAQPKPGDAPGAMNLQVRVRDPKFQPLDNAAVTLEVQAVMTEAVAGVSNNVVRMRAEPSANEPGLYEVTYVPRATGGYRATAFVTNTVGAEIGHPECGWSTDLASDEFRSLTPNVHLLESIAKRTGGQVVSAKNLEAFTRELPQRHAPVMEAWSYPLWHTPAMFGFALACLVSEWGIRRWKGLA